jgi:hypothetical protein
MIQSLINDDQSLLSATARGYSVLTYDDGFGPLWVMRDSMGISGIVRAQTWYDAYEICEDEIFPSPSHGEGPEEWEKEYGPDWFENAIWQENFGIRPNGARSQEEENSSFYQKDLNGELLFQLTEQTLNEYGIVLEIVDNEE